MIHIYAFLTSNFYDNACIYYVIVCYDSLYLTKTETTFSDRTYSYACS